MTIREAKFFRLGYSGNETFAEVQLAVDGFARPLIAAFKEEADGNLTLVNVSEKREDYDLDWFENNLHDAYPSVMERLFGAGSDGSSTRSSFAEQVLKFGGLREELQDQLYYGKFY